jgi:hypothetical protein
MPARTRRALKKRLNPSIGPTRDLDAPVVLFDDVVQIRASADLNGGLPTIIEFVERYATQRGMGSVRSRPRVITRGSPWRRNALRKKALAAVTSRVKVGLNRFALFVDGPVKVNPIGRAH